MVILDKFSNTKIQLLKKATFPDESYSNSCWEIRLPHITGFYTTTPSKEVIYIIMIISTESDLFWGRVVTMQRFASKI